MVAFVVGGSKWLYFGRGSSRLVCCASAGGGTVGRVYPCRFADAKRIVALGDLHGDLEATEEALTLGGVLGPSGEWIGGDTVLVQVGDVFDRGGKELAILELFEDLRAQARVQGGDVHVLLGNHELLNVALDFTFVSKEGFRSFDGMGVGEWVSAEMGKRLRKLPRYAWNRAMAMRPGGLIAKRLAELNLVIMVSLPVHNCVASLPTARAWS